MEKNIEKVVEDAPYTFDSKQTLNFNQLEKLAQKSDMIAMYKNA